MHEKAELLRTLLDKHKPHQKPGFSGRPPVAGERTPGRRQSSHPLDNLYQRGVIPKSSYIAGLRFRSDWELAHVTGEGTTNWDRFAPSLIEHVDELAFRRPAPKPVRRPPSSLPAARYDARVTLERLRVVCGSFGFQLMRGVCVMGIALSHISDAIGVHRDYVSLRFREALDDAAAFYGAMIDSRDEE